MLAPAIVYKDEITENLQKYYYTDDMFLVSGYVGTWIPQIENTDYGEFRFAITDTNNKLIGFLAYSVDWYCSRVYDFALFSFDRGNPLIGKTVYETITGLMRKYHKVSWYAIEGNPACKAYDNFIKKYNGTKHILRDQIKDSDGNYRNSILYEIINSDSSAV